MAGQNVKILGPQQLAGGPVTLYTAPSDLTTVIQHIHVSNPSASSVSFTMSLGVDSVITRIYDAYTIGAGQALDVFCKYVLIGGSIIQAWGSIANVLTLTVDGQSSPAPVVPQLQPVTDSPLAAWSCDGNVDRSGNGFALSAGQNLFCGDLIKGARGSFASIRGIASGNDAPFRITGEITVTARAWTGVLGSGFIAGCVASDNVFQCWSLSRGPNLIYQVSTPVPVQYAPAGGEFIVGSDWTFVAMRRTAAGVVTLNVNGAQATSGAMTVPTFSASNAFRIGGQSGLISSGGIADVAIFPSFLTDAQIQARRRVMMGL
jgi:hypothetical protein